MDGEEAANHVGLIYMALILTKWSKSDCLLVLFTFITLMDVLFACKESISTQSEMLQDTKKIQHKSVIRSG